MSRTFELRFALMTAALGVALWPGCAPSRAAGSGGVSAAPVYLPLRSGMRWTYRISDDRGRSADKVARVLGPAVLGFGRAGDVFRVQWDLLDGGVEIHWERRTPDGVGCLQEETRDASGMVSMEEAYDPPATVVDERPDRLSAGVTWSETFMDTTPNHRGHPKTRKATVSWTVESTNDQVTVPAGTFTCLRLRRSTKHGEPTISWFAKGVGLVKEQGAGPLGNETLALVQASSS
jgi:hypothetical protein